MLTRRSTLAFGMAGLASCLPFSASAHRENQTHSSILWNTRTRFLDITHIYHIHDAETALTQVGILEKPNLRSLKERARLALYTEKNFSLKTLDENALTLSILGAEFEGRNVYVYQQLALSDPPEGLLVNCTLLRPLIPGQVNDVDVNLSGRIRSLRFENSDGTKIALA